MILLKGSINIIYIHVEAIYNIFSNVLLCTFCAFLVSINTILIIINS